MTPAPSPRPLTEEGRTIIEAQLDTNIPFPNRTVVRLLNALDAERQRAERAEARARVLEGAVRAGIGALKDVDDPDAHDEEPCGLCAIREGMEDALAGKPPPPGGR